MPMEKQNTVENQLFGSLIIVRIKLRLSYRVGKLIFYCEEVNADGKAEHGRKSACPHDNSDGV